MKVLSIKCIKFTTIHRLLGCRTFWAAYSDFFESLSIFIWNLKLGYTLVVLYLIILISIGRYGDVVLKVWTDFNRIVTRLNVIQAIIKQLSIANWSMERYVNVKIGEVHIFTCCTFKKLNKYIVCSCIFLSSHIQ